jgi:hypothetical protein
VLLQYQNVKSIVDELYTKLVLKLDNKRRLHISKLRSLCEEKDNLKGLGWPYPRPYPHRRRKQHVRK